MKTLVGMLLLCSSLVQAAPWLETTLEPETPWLGQQVRYIQRLYRDSHLQQGDFLPPEVDGALRMDAGEREPRVVLRRGRRMELVEHHWLLFPLRSGEIRLPPPMFSGRDFYLQGEPGRLRVRPPPAEAGDFPWLVSPEVTMTEQWDGALERLQPGDFRVREIRLRARDQLGAQLPALSPAPAAGFEIQPLPGRVSERFEQGTLWGERVQRFRYLATSEARGRLPPVQVKWWNPNRQKVRSRELPAKPYRILPAAVPAPASPPAPATNPAPAARTVTSDEPSKRTGPWIVVLFLLGISIVGLAGWVVRRRLSPWRSRLALWWACQRGDPCRAARILLQWWRTVGWPEMPPQAHRAWTMLDAACFGRQPAGSWDGRRAWPLLRFLLARPRSRASGKVKTDALPPLWPGGTQGASCCASSPEGEDSSVSGASGGGS